LQKHSANIKKKHNAFHVKKSFCIDTRGIFYPDPSLYLLKELQSHQFEKMCDYYDTSKGGGGARLTLLPRADPKQQLETDPYPDTNQNTAP
jgi:hypothetical protein